MASVAGAYPSRAYNGVTFNRYILATNTLAYFAKAIPVSDNEKKFFFTTLITGSQTLPST
jgi:hypothetical protein